MPVPTCQMRRALGAAPSTRIHVPEMKAAAEKRTAEITAAVSTQIAEAEARIAKAKAEALNGLRAIAAETARDVVGKLAALTPEAGAVDTAVAAALKESR